MTTAAPRLVAVGADGAHGGWLTACLFEDEVGARSTTLTLHDNFADLVAVRAGSDAVMAVDVPMGLLDQVSPRPCDKQARSLLGARASTVFAPPSRPLLAAVTYDDARAIVAELKATDPAAAGISAQAFGIVPKVREVDEWLRAHPGAQAWLYECHPELSFYAMAGAPLADKRSAHGQVARLQHVAAESPDAPQVIAASGFRARDADLTDALDAYAALSSALHVRDGDFEQLGDDTPDSAGLLMRIVL
jgi:predicted RNase H-like nuclease